jgi:hypothetical protein
MREQQRENRASAAACVEPLEARALMAGDVVLHWNEVLLQSLPGPPSPIPLSRNMAIVHLAMFDAVNAIDRSYEPYHADVHASRGASMEAAAAQAAHDTLSALYPARREVYDAELAEDLEGIAPGRARQGVAVGREVAEQILALRANDRASTAASYTPPNTNPGQWQPTPPDFSPAGAANVPGVTPFATTSPAQFRPGPPPALTSAAYAAAFNQTKELGARTGSTRTADQTLVAGLWRLPLTNTLVWNHVAQDVSEDRGLSITENARLFALLNMSLHDGLQTSFASKFHYALWRPVTAIQRAGEDGNPATEADPGWMTLHPATPPYPTYAGNAATIGATMATVLSNFFGDAVPIQIDWSPYGVSSTTRSYPSAWDAAVEQGWSRVYGGIHFSFDSVAGQQIGNSVGDYVTGNFLTERGTNRSFNAGPPAAPATTGNGAQGIGGGIYRLWLTEADDSPVN